MAIIVSGGSFHDKCGAKWYCNELQFLCVHILICGLCGIYVCM